MRSLCDLERDNPRPHLGGAHAIVFAAGAGRRGEVPRDDVALVVLECLGAGNTIRRQFELLAGDTPAREAVRAL